MIEIRKLVTKYFQKAVAIIVGITLFLFPLFFISNNFTDQYIIPKWYAFIMITLVISLSIITVKTVRFIVDKLTFGFILLFLYIIFHALYSGNSSMVILILISWLLLYCFFKQQYLISKNIISIIIMVGIISQAVYGMVQYFCIMPSNSKIAISGSYDNPAGFAMCLSIGFPFLFEGVMSKKKFVKILSIIGGCIVALAIFLSESRTGIISIAIVSCIYACRRYKLIITKQKKLIISLVLFIGIVIGIVLFALKKDSTYGRINIWNITTKMILNNPIYGAGIDSFNSLYMPEQAKYFEQNPNSKCSQLADNVNHPLNEFLCITFEFGIIALLLMLSVLFFAIKYNIKQQKVLSIYMLIVCVMFSYPFKYPFIWVISCFVLAQLSMNVPIIRVITFQLNWLSKIIFLLILSIFICIGIKELNKELTWTKISIEMDNKSYRNLYNKWPNNSLFTYNYAALLHYDGQYAESLEVILECEKRYNDYDVQMIIAENYRRLKNWELSEKHFILASNMCPNRFMPYYNLMCMYRENGSSKKAICMAKKIISKPVKIHSTMISFIIKEAHDCVRHFSNPQL